MTWLAPAQSEEHGESSSQYSYPSAVWPDESANLVQDTAWRGQRDPFWYPFTNPFVLDAVANNKPSL